MKENLFLQSFKNARETKHSCHICQFLVTLFLSPLVLVALLGEALHKTALAL